MEHEWVTESNGQCTSSVRQLVRSAANTLNAEETQQRATILVTEMNDLKQKGYVMAEKIGEGSYSTVCLAYCAERTS
jgi:hypothetical protein